ncbi:uncharacterized protein LOC127639489 [Xyrauchen texanus]|uniref:uncharacterized protein LOC127639489 n=1 Tax=Xyrauchen texanus TaxID=154827 RepID=UPI002242BB9B|nr:uncharacterized protein LOC127639489 [Xyrauchen texanus]
MLSSALPSVSPSALLSSALPSVSPSALLSSTLPSEPPSALLSSALPSMSPAALTSVFPVALTSEPSEYPAAFTSGPSKSPVALTLPASASHPLSPQWSHAASLAQQEHLHFFQSLTAYELNVHRMKTVQLSIFYLLLCCPAAESFKDKLVVLGQNVTLNCDLAVKDVYWLFLKLPDSLEMILRTFSTESTVPQFYNNRFRDKYSTLTWSRLFISNITADELGIYYCAKLLQLDNGTRLYITENSQNQTESEFNNHRHHHHPQQIVTVASIALNCVMFILIIGLLMLKFKTPTKSRQQCQNDEPVQLEDLNTAQYSEIDCSPYSTAVQSSQINSTYVFLQNPKPNPQHTPT